jgi:DNA-binding beta-propeller fold protein YncE
VNVATERRDPRRRIALGSGLLALLVVAMLAIAARAQATENIYWDNYEGSPVSVSVADISGSGGGVLNIAGSVIEEPEGMAYDSVTNRLFVANSGGPGKGQITFINLDGSGAGVFSAPGAPVEEPEGVTLDPVTRMIYWINVSTTAGPDTISWAKLDGSAGGVLNTTGATLEGAFRIAVDPVGGKVYWGNNPTVGPHSISFANANNTGGGGNLSLTGATPPEDITGIVVDPAGGRVYWLDDTGQRISFASLAGGGGGDVNMTGSVFAQPFGLAFDPSIGRLYWGNYNAGSTVPTNAIGFVNLGGGGGGISPTTAPVAGPQDPVILKSPTGTGAPAVARSKSSRAALTCSTGAWAADLPGSLVYQAPRTFAYQWTRNAKPIGGAIAAAFTAKSPGSYGCIVTAANQTGSAAQTSGGLNVKASKLKLTTKKKAKVHPGGVATFKVKAVNQGDLKSKNAKVCVKLPKAAKGDLKAPKCKSLGKVKSRGKKTATLKINVGKDAVGTYKVTFTVHGSAGKSAKSKIVVAAPKK